MTALPPTDVVEFRSTVQATRVESVDAEGRTMVSLPGGPAPAEVAVAGGYEPSVGDTVLVASDGAHHFVIGVLGPARAARAVTADGVAAALEREDGTEVLRVRDARGALLFEHRPGNKTTVVHVPGDLEIRADAGSVRVVARDGIELQAARAQARVEHAELRATTLSTTLERARHVVGALETVAGRVLERAKSVYREVEGLSQTRAGRMRLVAEQALHLLGQRALVKAREDVKVKGEKIYLA